MTHPPVRFAAHLLACMAMCLAPQVASAQPAVPVTRQKTPAPYKLEPGPYNTVTVKTIKLKDDKRAKDLEIIVRAPATRTDATKGEAPDEKFPLIVFSHGAGGSSEAFSDLSEHLASHGYVVVHPTHSDSLKLRRQNGEKINLREEMKTIVSKVDSPDRVADVKLILDSLDRIESLVEGLRSRAGTGRIDRDRIAMTGHSAGALTTQIIAGVRIRGPRWGHALQIKSHGDPRIKCAIVISGQGLTNLMFTDASWSELSTPMLVMTGSLDVSGVSNETPESRRHPFELAKPGDKYLLWIEGATHASYQGKSAARLLAENPTTDVDVIAKCVAATSVAFLDKYLKGDEAGLEFLKSDAVSAMSDGKASVTSK